MSRFKPVQCVACQFFTVTLRVARRSFFVMCVVWHVRLSGKPSLKKLHTIPIVQLLLKVLSVLFLYIQYFPFLSFPFIENTQTYWHLNDTLARSCLHSLRSTQSEVWYNQRPMRVCVVQHNRSITKGLENMHGTTAGNFSWVDALRKQT